MKEGLEANRKICQKQQTELRHMLLSDNQCQYAFQLFFKQHAMLHSASMAQTEPFSLEDEVFEDLSDDIARQIPRTSQNSIIWNIWHIARIEDVAMNMLVAESTQVFTGEIGRPNWGSVPAIQETQCLLNDYQPESEYPYPCLARLPGCSGPQDTRDCEEAATRELERQGRS